MKPAVMDGRRLACPGCNNRRVCSSCGSRIRYGAPNPEGNWEALRMDEMDWRRLMLAAAEFDDIARQHGEDAHAVEFVDWIFRDVVEPAA